MYTINPNSIYFDNDDDTVDYTDRGIFMQFMSVGETLTIDNIRRRAQDFANYQANNDMQHAGFLLGDSEYYINMASSIEGTVNDLVIYGFLYKL